MASPRSSVSSRALGVAVVCVLVAATLVVATSSPPAGAAGIAIENPSSWLETRAVAAGDPATTIGGTESARVMRATFVVRHDLSTPVTSVQIETQITNNTCEANSSWYTTANNSGDRQLSITELPNHLFASDGDTNYTGVGYSLVKFTWNQQSEWGGSGMRDHVSAPSGSNRRDWQTCAKVRLSDNTEATAGLMPIHLVMGYSPGTDEDFQYASNAASSQFNQAVTVGSSLSFVAKIDDPDSSGCGDEADGYRIHLLNLVTGVTTQVFDSGRLGQPSEPYEFTRSVTFPARGRYAVQVEVGVDVDNGDWGLDCDNGPNWSDGSGKYEIGSVDVNDPPGAVTFTRSNSLADPANGGITPGSSLAVNASFADDSDAESQAINLVDWDRSSSQTPRYARTKQASGPITGGIASPATTSFGTDVPPNDYTVRAGVYDNGSMVASSSGSNTKSSSGSIVVRVANPATAAVTCSPSPVPKNATSTCTATVTDTVVTGVGTRAKVDPTGTVNFAKVAGDGAMTFTPASCTLTPQGGGVSTCSTSAGVTLGDTYTVGATWAGDTKHRPVTQVANTVSYGNRRTQITTSCAPTVISVNSTTSCTFRVSDIDIGTKSAPLGTNAVSITVSEGASPQSTNKCTLVTLNASESTCAIVINGGSTGGVNGLKTIAASFTGPGTGTTGHRSSSGFGSFNVQGITPGGNRHSTTSSVSCTLTNVPVNSANTCTATVTDTDSGPTNPLGVVTFYTSGGASPNQATCTLSVFSPGVSKCSVNITALAKASKGTWAFYNGSINHKTSSSSPVIWYGT